MLMTYRIQEKVKLVSDIVNCNGFRNRFAFAFFFFEMFCKIVENDTYISTFFKFCENKLFIVLQII